LIKPATATRRQNEPPILRPNRLKKPAVATAASCVLRPTATPASAAAPHGDAAGALMEMDASTLDGVVPPGLARPDGTSMTEAAAPALDARSADGGS
jgi:hypothetical protein